MKADAGNQLISFLAGHDEPCPVCGYNLRGVREPVCPECAAELRLSVASARTRPGPWLVGVIAVALGLGFDAVVATIMTVGLTVAYVGGGVLTPQPVRMAGLFIAFTLASAVALALVLKRRQAWARLPRPTQWGLGWGVFVLVGVVHVGFAVLIFALA